MYWQVNDNGRCGVACAEQELRVGHNDLPGLPAALEDNARLKIVDVGGCPIRTIEAIQVCAIHPFPCPPHTHTHKQLGHMCACTPVGRISLCMV